MRLVLNRSTRNYRSMKFHDGRQSGINSPVEVGSEIPIIIQGFWHHPKVVGNGISEPSTMWFFWTHTPLQPQELETISTGSKSPQSQMRQLKLKADSLAESDHGKRQECCAAWSPVRVQDLFISGLHPSLLSTKSSVTWNKKTRFWYNKIPFEKITHNIFETPNYQYLSPPFLFFRLSRVVPLGPGR